MNRQNVNLYHKEFRREASWLSQRVAGFASLAVLALILVIATQKQLEHDHVLAEKNRLDSQLALVSSEVKSIKKTLSDKGVRPEVLNRINDVRAEIKANESIMNSLGLQSETTFKGFSPYMLALARQNIKGLWLTDFYVSELKQDLLLIGKTRRAELLPAYLKKLSDEEVFKGRSFNSFRIVKNQKKPNGSLPLDFVVTTEESLPPLEELFASSD